MQLPDPPLISILVPVYNKEQFVGRCLSSLIAQTYRNLEIMVWDDASTDDSLRVVEAFADCRIRIFRSRRRLLPSIARNRLWQLARGEYITFQDADDYSNVFRIEDQLGILRENKRNLSYAARQDTDKIVAGQFLCSPRELLQVGAAFRKTFCSAMTLRNPLIPFCEDLPFMHEYVWCRDAAFVHGVEAPTTRAPLYYYSTEPQADRYLHEYEKWKASGSEGKELWLRYLDRITEKSRAARLGHLRKK